MDATLRQFRRTTWRRSLLLFVMMSLLVAACATPAAPTTAPAQATTAPTDVPLPATIKVGVVVPLTGRYAAGGDQVRNGYVLAVEDINAAGGVEVMGTNIPLELVILDDESDPAKTVQHMETLYSGEHVVSYLGGFGSDLHAAAAAIA